MPAPDRTGSNRTGPAMLRLSRCEISAPSDPQIAAVIQRVDALLWDNPARNHASAIHLAVNELFGAETDARRLELCRAAARAWGDLCRFVGTPPGGRA